MKPVVTFSIEVELGWSHHGTKEKNGALTRGRSNVTRACRRLVEACEQRGIPMTFNFVGHLLLDGCGGDHDGPHSEGWFDQDPGADRAASAPKRYAPDLLELIRGSSIDHEIATHTFSHVFTEECGADVLDWELQRVRKLHAERGLPAPVSFIPPRQREVDYPTLTERGLEVVRVSRDADVAPPDSRIRRFVWLLDRPHVIEWPRRVGGLVESPCTPYPTLTAESLPTGAEPPKWPFRLLPVSVRQRMHRRHLRRGLRRVVDEESAIHFWTHLYNLGNDAQWPPVEDLLDRAGEWRDRGDIEIRPMRELVEVV